MDLSIEQILFEQILDPLVDVRCVSICEQEALSLPSWSFQSEEEIRGKNKYQTNKAYNCIKENNNASEKNTSNLRLEE